MSRARRILRRAAIAVGVTLVTLAALVVAVVAHVETDVGLAAAEHLMEWSGSSASRGTVRIGRVRSLPPGRLSLLDYQIIAPNGEVVIDSEELAGMFEPSGLLDGQVRFRPSWFVRTNIRLTRGPGGQVNLVHASEVPEDRFTVPLVFQDIRLEDNTIFLDLPGKPAVTMRHVYGLADLHIGHYWRWRLDGNHGDVDLPIVETSFREMSGRLSSDHAHPLVVRMVVDVAVAEPSVAMDYYVPALAGEEGEPYLDLDLFEDVDGHGVDETEEQEEARDDLAEAREEREEVERALAEAREGGHDDEARELEDALAERRRDERRAREAAVEAGVERSRRGDRERSETASAEERREVRELSRERPDREVIEERERQARAEVRERRRAEEREAER